jgi:hypothetical protein
MNRRPTKVPAEFVALLQAFQFDRPSTAPLQELDDDQWRKLLDLCDTAHLTLSLAHLITASQPLWVMDRLKTNLADNALRYEKIRTTYQEAAAALDRAGIPHIVMKGFTQAPDYVTSPKLRMQSDLDFFCQPDQIPAALAALEELGYRSQKSADITSADHGHALVRSGNWQWKGNLFDPVMPLGIELHFCLWNPSVSRLAIPEIDDFWDRRTQRQIGDFSFPCLSPIDHLGHLALHILRNLFLRDWIIHHVYELASFLHSHAEDDAFWNDWLSLHSPSLRPLEVIAFYHAREWFGCSLHPYVQEEIARLPESQLQWLEHFSNSALENMFHQNKDTLWLHLSLLSSKRDQWEIFRRTLIPPRVASLHAPIVRVRNKRSVQSTSGPRRQYLNYLIARSTSHSVASLTTLARGLLWWISR